MRLRSSTAPGRRGWTCPSGSVGEGRLTRLRTWTADGTWDRALTVQTVLLAQVGADGDLGWVVAVDSTVVRAHQHAAGGRQKEPRPASRATMGSVGPAADCQVRRPEARRLKVGHGVVIDELREGRLCFTPGLRLLGQPIEAHFRPLRQFTIADPTTPTNTVQPLPLHAYLRWRNANARHRDVLAAERRERARIRSEKRIR